MTIETTETINLKDIENLRKWAEYMPKCFTNNLEDEKFNDRLIEDRYIINRINKLYSFIENIKGAKPDLNDENFHIGQLSFDQYEKYEKLIKIPSVSIEEYADLKLTDEEKEYCYSYVENCTKDNSFVIDAKVNNIENFFLKSYTKYLLVNHPKSDYISSVTNISKNMAVIDKKLIKKFKQIRDREIKAWETSKNRIYN